MISIELTLKRAIDSHHAGNLKEAEKYYRSILERQPASSDASHNLGLLLLSTEHTAEALSLLKTAVYANPSREEFWISHINALIKTCDFKGAKQAIKKAKRKGFKLKNMQALLSLSSKSAQINIPSQEELVKLSKYYEGGRYDLAEKLAIRLSKRFPKHNFSFKILASILKKTGRLSDAMIYGKQAVVISPNDAEAHFNLANTLTTMGMYLEAESVAREAINLRPEFVEAHNNLGTTLKELGRLAEAEDSFTQAINLKPDFVDALRNRWLILYEKKEFNVAMRDADALVAKGARQFDLTTLYALGRTDDIYSRIEVKARDDAVNLSVAAFASFFAEAERKNNAYNFCPNPLNFIHISNLSKHVAESDRYLRNIIEEIENIETIWEPSGKSTAHGFQSPPDINIFKNPSKIMAHLKSIILAELEAFRLKFEEERCLFISQWPLESDLFGWCVILKHQGYQKAHIHPGGWLSGVIYLQVVPSKGAAEGAIEFSFNGPHYHNSNSPSMVIQPTCGDIIFFPSSLHHKTIPFTTESDRIIISFDIVPVRA